VAGAGAGDTGAGVGAGGGGGRRGAMTDGSATGLVDASVVVKEAAEKRKIAQARILQMMDEQSGRGPTTQFRNQATGQMMDADEMRKLQELASKTKERERPVWASGVAQAGGAMEAHAAFREEATNPFARANIDPRAEREQRDAVRFSDPMAGPCSICILNFNPFQLNFKPFVSEFISEPTEVIPLHNSKMLELSST